MKVSALFISIILFSISNAVFSQTNGYDSVPVRLSTLEARTIGNAAKLDWKVVCFLEYARFDIQRSSNGVNFTTINTFEADRLRCKQPFDFTDVNISGNTFYRIRVGDQDGRIYHSKIVAVVGKDKNFEINSLTPTAVTSSATLSVSSANTDKAEIMITNFQGKIVKRFTVSLIKGVTELPVDAGNLANGYYILTVVNGSSKTKAIRFTKL